MAAPRLAHLRPEHRAPGDALGLGTPAPRLSWRTETSAAGWRQAAYEIELDGISAGRVASADSVLVPWPGAPLRSRERRVVRARVWGEDGGASDWSAPLALEAGL